jgi:hypothetical protein
VTGVAAPWHPSQSPLPAAFVAVTGFTHDGLFSAKLARAPERVEGERNAAGETPAAGDRDGSRFPPKGGSEKSGWRANATEKLSKTHFYNWTERRGAVA